MKPLKRCAWLLGLLGSVNSASADVLVTFDRSEYFVTSAGEAFDIQIIVDADDSTVEIDPVPAGLFSFGTAITFDATKADISGVGAIQVAADLDHFGFSSGGFVEADTGRVAAKGNIDQTLNPLVSYADSLLVSASLTNQLAPVGSYPLELDFFRTLGANEQLFLDGAGVALDDSIVFGRAIVHVVPEPSTFVLGALLWLGLCVHRMRP